MESRTLTTDDITEAAAKALGKTPKEIKTSETFEQAIYDMARENAPVDLDKLDLSGQAQYQIRDNILTITYKKENLRYGYSFIKTLADFYNAYFPATNVSAYQMGPYGKDTISFSAIPFIEIVLPAMQLWKNKPSELVLRINREAHERGPSFKEYKPLMAGC